MTQITFFLSGDTPNRIVGSNEKKYYSFTNLILLSNKKRINFKLAYLFILLNASSQI